MLQNSLWIKWRILFLVLPFTILFVLCKSLVHHFGWGNWNFDALASALVAATTFVTAFVLSGILSDYKLSEGLPVEICSSIEAIADCNRMEAKNHPNYDPVPLQHSLTNLLEEIYNWLVKNYSFDPVLQQITDLSKWYAILEEYSAPPLISRLQVEQAKLRQVVMRIHVIRETDFVPAAYAVLELFTAATIFALLLVNGDSYARDLTISAALFTAFIYLQLLIRDLDNPFDYNGRSSADVALSIITITLKRLKQF
ncbi:MAG: hypothetical protein MUD14_29710 [Hydrococcus sp. Prado102]|jgi:hypothetical protein|nr:hypothetical protein [Hydrococcus sp. Prado102]